MQTASGESTGDRTRPAAGGKTLPRFLIVAVASLLGAAGGWWVFGASPLVLLGWLFGFLAGRTISGLVYRDEEEGPVSSRLPNAHLAFGLVIGGWALALGLVALVSATGMLRGEGATLLLFLVLLPLGVLCALTSGPTASALAQRALRQIQHGQRPESERGLANLALRLGQATSLVALGLLLYLLALVYR